jgi:PAS domain S-box-containing protein
LTSWRGPFRRFGSIRAHLVALVAVTALPLVGLLVHATRHEYRLAIDQGQLRAHTLADATATSTRALIDVVHDALGATAARAPEALLGRSTCTEELAHVKETLTFLPSILVADASGVTICSTEPVPDSTVVDVSARGWFRDVMEGAAFAVGSPVVGQITHAWVVALAVPVRGDAGVVAVLAASVPLVTFQELLSGVTVGPDDLVTISNTDRTIVARSQDPERWVGRQLPPERAQREDVRTGYVGTEAVDAEGVRRTWASVEIPELGWTVHGGIPTEEVLGPARASLRQRIILGLATLLLVAGLGFAVQSRITRSVRHLVKAAKSAAEGHSVTIPRGTPTELAVLAQAFNRTLLGRLRAEREERRAKERFRAMVDNAVLGIYVSTEDGSFLEVNPAFASLMGYERPEELLAIGPEALYRDPAQRAALVEAYRDGDLVDGLELDWIRKDGTPVTVRLHGKLVPVAGTQRAFEIMVEDVTEKRRLEEQLHTTQKMEAVGRLAGGLAHDYNNVLTVIRVNAELAATELEAGHPGRDSIDEIVRATQGAQRLTRQLLSFTRGREEEPCLVKPNEVIRGVETMLSRIIGEDVRLQADLDPAVPFVRMDAGQLEQVLMNLAVNARDALPDGGRIVVTSSLRTVGPDAAAGGDGSDVADAARWVLLTVEDDGVGMDADTRARVFEPFFTTKGAGQGTGLGLSTAYAIVTGAGGRIGVDSKPARGTRFDVWLPAVLEGPSDGGEERPREPVRGGGETVLLVEDNSAVRRAVRRTLEAAGYHVIVGRDGQEGIDQLHAYRGHIDLVLTDVVMPNVSGPELADHVDLVRPATPILFMSGYTAEHLMAERIARDGVGFIPKPFEVGDLLVRVRTALDRSAGEPVRDRGDEGGIGSA